MSISGMTVRQVGLTGVVQTVPEAASIREVAKLMTDRGTNAVLVVGSGQEPLGILTSHDIVVRITNTGKDAATMKAGQVMSAPLISAGFDEDMGSAITIMVRRNIRQLPILDRKGRAVSLLTLNDIVQLHLAGTVDLTHIANRLVELPDQQTAPTISTPSSVAEEREEAEQTSDMPKVFQSQLPFRSSVPPSQAPETRPDAAAGKSASIRAVPAAIKRVPADHIARHRDGRRRRTLVEKVRRGYNKNKLLVIVVSAIAIVVFFAGMIMLKIGTLFDAYQASHYEPKDEERAKLLEQR
jgi:CBS domain-containing protein